MEKNVENGPIQPIPEEEEAEMHGVVCRVCHGDLPGRRHGVYPWMCRPCGDSYRKQSNG